MTAKPKQKKIPPSAEVEVIEDVFIPHARRLPSRGADLAAARCREKPLSGDSRIPAVSQARRHRAARRCHARFLGFARLRLRARRFARVRRFGRADARRIHGARARGRRGGDCVAGVASVVRRQGRHGGGFLGADSTACKSPRCARPRSKPWSPFASPDERYNGDIHYRGGALLGDNFGWSTQMLAYSARPPDPQIVGARWRQMWIARLKNMPLLAANWARASVARRFLAARLGVRGLRRDRGGGVGDRRLGGCVCRFGRAAWSKTCAPPRAESSARGCTNIRISPNRGRRFRSPSRPCAGGIFGSKAKKTGRWTGRVCARI